MKTPNVCVLLPPVDLAATAVTPGLIIMPSVVEATFYQVHSTDHRLFPPASESCGASPFICVEVEVIHVFFLLLEVKDGKHQNRQSIIHVTSLYTQQAWQPIGRGLIRAITNQTTES